MDPGAADPDAGGRAGAAPRGPGPAPPRPALRPPAGPAELDAVIAAIPPELCVQCKAARALCGIDPCPLLAKVRSHLPRSAPRSRDLTGSSPPSLFVGRHGYPKVRIGPMLPPDHRDEAAARHLDDPRGWLGLSIPDVVGLRSGLV